MIRIQILNMDKSIFNRVISVLSAFRTKVTIEIEYFTNHKYELDYCMRNPDADIIILDSNYKKDGEHDGIFIARRLKIFSRNSLIIHIAENDDNLYEITNSEPFAYLRYNEMEENLKDAINRALAIITKIDETFYFTKRGEKYSVPFNKIIYFCSDHRIINIVCEDKSQEQFYAKMDDIEGSVSKVTNNFIRVNQSYLINIKYTLNASRNEVIMMDHSIITVTRKYKDNIHIILKELEL